MTNLEGLYYLPSRIIKTTVIKTVWHQDSVASRQTNRSKESINRWHIYGQLISNKGAKPIQLRKAQYFLQNKMLEKMDTHLFKKKPKL